MLHLSEECILCKHFPYKLSLKCLIFAKPILSFFNPFVQFVNTIPVCVIGGICIALYGFIAVSGLKMLQKVDLGTNRNLMVVASILVPGIGGLTLKFGPITLTNIATALILGIIVNAILSIGEKKAEEE